MWRIRELSVDDETVLRNLTVDATAFEDDGAEISARPLDPEDASALLEDPSTHVWVALVDDRVVGFLLAYELRRRHGDPVELFVYELGVHHSWRRRGVGTALIHHVKSWADAVGIRRGFVMTGAGNAAAIAFYESLGWRADDEPDLVFSFDVTRD